MAKKRETDSFQLFIRYIGQECICNDVRGGLVWYEPTKIGISEEEGKKGRQSYFRMR